MNIYKKEYKGKYGGGVILIAAHTSEQAEEIITISRPWINGFEPAEKLDNCRCYNENPGIILSNYYIE